MCSKVSVAHTQDDPPDASIIKAIGAASKSNRNFALARREEAFDITPWPLKYKNENIKWNNKIEIMK